MRIVKVRTAPYTSYSFSVNYGKPFSRLQVLGFMHKMQEYAPKMNKQTKPEKRTHGQISDTCLPLNAYR